MSSTKRWIPIAAACLLAAIIALVLLNWEGYVLSWGGSMFKAISGALIGWAISKFVLRLNLSAIPDEARPIAALSQAILIAGIAIAVASSV